MTRTAVVMGTMVTIEIAGARDNDRELAVDGAFGWFRRVEACCSRFNPDSELMQLTATVGVPVPVSRMLFEAVRFAVAVAEETGGAFDPTVGREMEARGFNREYSTGRIVRTGAGSAASASFRDVLLDPDRGTITLRRPLTLDLGAVAKGLAIDTAARELRAFEDFAIEAGGDLYLAGRNPDGDPWAVGIRDPQLHDRMIDTLRVSNQAVCSSGNYERPGVDGRGHILDARTGQPADEAESATVVADTAMLADAMATAAFVLGPVEGLELLERAGVEGLIVSRGGRRHETPGLKRA